MVHWVDIWSHYATKISCYILWLEDRRHAWMNDGRSNRSWWGSKKQAKAWWFCCLAMPRHAASLDSWNAKMAWGLASCWRQVFVLQSGIPSPVPGDPLDLPGLYSCNRIWDASHSDEGLVWMFPFLGPRGFTNLLFPAFLFTFSASTCWSSHFDHAIDSFFWCDPQPFCLGMLGHFDLPNKCCLKTLSSIHQPTSISYPSLNHPSSTGHVAVRSCDTVAEVRQRLLSASSSELRNEVETLLDPRRDKRERVVFVWSDRKMPGRWMITACVSIDLLHYVIHIYIYLFVIVYIAYYIFISYIHSTLRPGHSTTYFTSPGPLCTQCSYLPFKRTFSHVCSFAASTCLCSAVFIGLFLRTT